MQDCFATLMTDPGCRVRRGRARSRARRRHPRHLCRLPAQGPCGIRQACVPGGQPPGNGFGSVGDVGDPRRLPGASTGWRRFCAAPGACSITATFALAARLRRPRAPAAALSAWRARLGSGAILDECESIRLLHDFGIPVNACRVVGTEADAQAAARELGFPVVAKTAERGIHHKSDRGGVRLRLGDEASRIRRLS